MLQNRAIAYLRGYEGETIGVYKVSKMLRDKYKEGKYDRKKGLPNRYLK
tara:strand:- start:460 stop:606 length:147 start_codon:yes stop_codon:yes gene_type:complete